MALPKIEHPINEVYLKSLDRKIRFRPFLVKEEKILMIAKESEDNNDIKNAIIQVLQNCCLDDNVNVAELPLFDIEMFFIHLRIRSVGDSAKLTITCSNVPEGATEPCGHVTDFNMDLNKIEYEVPEDHTPYVSLTSDIGIKLKYPTVSIIDNEVVDEYTATIKVIADNIDYIYDKDSVYKKETISKEELENFIDDLTVDQINAIRSFFAATPKSVLNDTVTCKKCGFKHDIHLGDLNSFFS